MALFGELYQDIFRKRDLSARAKSKMPEQTDDSEFQNTRPLVSKNQNHLSGALSRPQDDPRGHDDITTRVTAWRSTGIDIIQARNEQRGRRHWSVRDPSSRICEAMRSAYGGSTRGREHIAPVVKTRTNDVVGRCRLRWVYRG